MDINNEKISPDVLKSAVEREMQQILARELLPEYRELHEIMVYHMGWDDEESASYGGGKRLRPIFLLLSASAAGGKWQDSLPAAAAVELLHNFSLIHDDIQDESPVRHGRESVWKKWNLPLAINAGDTMFSLANAAMLDLSHKLSPQTTLQAQKILLETCVKLTYGQHLDISNEGKNDIEISDYLNMIEGKTAVLVGACMRIGVLTAGGDLEKMDLADRFGKALGMAFQVKDDILGIWGKTSLTGKSIDGDLMQRKLSLPILFGLKQGKAFARRWEGEDFRLAEIPDLANMLEEEGARTYSEELAGKYTDQALDIYDKMGFNNEAGILLREMSESLISRNF